MFFKGDCKSKHFNFFVFSFNVSNKKKFPIKFSYIFYPPPPPSLLNFEEFSNPHVYSKSPSIRHSRVRFLNTFILRSSY